MQLIKIKNTFACCTFFINLYINLNLNQMSKKALFFVMLMLCMGGGLVLTPVPAMASVAPQTIKVSGQVIEVNPKVWTD